MTDNQTVRIHGHLHKISRKLFVITMLLVALIILVSFCTLLILGNLANISVAQEDTLNQVMELRQELEAAEPEPVPEVEEPTVYTLTPKEFDLTCRVVAGEARGEDLQGQMAVAQVIRDRSATWDMSVTDVVTSPGQFAAPYDGKISDETHLAVANVFNGGASVLEIPTTHFHANYISPYWTADKESRGSIGRHKFWY